MWIFLPRTTAVLSLFPFPFRPYQEFLFLRYDRYSSNLSAKQGPLIKVIDFKEVIKTKLKIKLGKVPFFRHL